MQCLTPYREDEIHSLPSRPQAAVAIARGGGGGGGGGELREGGGGGSVGGRGAARVSSVHTSVGPSAVHAGRHACSQSSNACQLPNTHRNLAASRRIDESVVTSSRDSAVRQTTSVLISAEITVSASVSRAAELPSTAAGTSWQHANKAGGAPCHCERS